MRAMQTSRHEHSQHCSHLDMVALKILNLKKSTSMNMFDGAYSMKIIDFGLTAHLLLSCLESVNGGKH